MAMTTDLADDIKNSHPKNTLDVDNLFRFNAAVIYDRRYTTTHVTVDRTTGLAPAQEIIIGDPICVFLKNHPNRGTIIEWISSGLLTSNRHGLPHL